LLANNLAITSLVLKLAFYLFLEQGCEAKFHHWVSSHLAIIIGVAIGLIAIQVVLKEFHTFRLTFHQHTSKHACVGLHVLCIENNIQSTL